MCEVDKKSVTVASLTRAINTIVMEIKMLKVFKTFAMEYCTTKNICRVVSPILARRRDMIKKVNRWKSYIQRFKTLKQAI